MEFGQFCPIAKSTEILGEKWTILIIRELLMGGSRFNELQRGLGTISPAILTKRLNSLIKHELVIKQKISGQKGYQYFPTNAAQELQPILTSLGDWGMRWTRKYLTDNDFDADFLMLYLKRSINCANLTAPETIIKFHFTDLKRQPHWWLIANRGNVDVCTLDPGHDVDVYFTCTVKCLADIWMGQSSYKAALKSGELTLVGRSYLTKNVSVWLTNCQFAKQTNT
ncbi:winged helix-turn-helix transcriptional regulator [Colwelliaceae bacterium BS250]